MPLVTNNLYVSGNVSSLNVTGAIKPTGGIVLEDADMKLSQINDGTLLECITLDAGDGTATVVVNEGGSNIVDFRVESDKEDEALFLDASENHFYINKGQNDFTASFHNDDDVVMTIGPGGAIFNQDSNANVDFRIETDGEDEAFFVDSSTNTIYINKGETDVTSSFHNIDDVVMTIKDNGVVFNEDSNSVIDFRIETNGEDEAFFIDSSANTIYINKGETDVTSSFHNIDDVVMTIKDNGVVFNEDSSSVIDVRMESNAATHAFFLDASGEKMLFGLDGATAVGSIGIVQVRANTSLSANTAMLVVNDGDSTNSRGIRIDCGKDDASGTNTSMLFHDGDGTQQGTITFSAGTVSYNAFTAGHVGTVADSSAHEYGVLLKVTGIENDLESSNKSRQVTYTFEKTTVAADKAAFGVYAGDYNCDDTRPDLHLVNALGDGHVYVCSEGGDISIGDYICSSNVDGYGMKQSDDLLHNYTVAKAIEAVSWSQESGTTKLIACTYHAS